MAQPRRGVKDAIVGPANPEKRETAPRELSPDLEPEDSPFSPPGRWGIGSYELNVARTLLEPIELEARGEGHKEIYPRLAHSTRAHCAELVMKLRSEPRLL